MLGLFALTLLTICDIGHAFVIAKDCGDKSAEIKKRVEYAFTRIGVSTQQLHKVINNAPDVNTNIKTTASYLFKEGEYQFVYDNLNNLQTHGSVGFLSDKDNDNTQDDPNNQPSNHYDASETIIYCTNQRIEIVDLKYVDTTWNYQIRDETYRSCFDKEGVLQAFTVSWGNNNQATPSIIQLCPWYLKSAYLEEQPTKCSALQLLSGKVADKWNNILKKNVKVAADAYTDFVGVLLHELTHTKAGGQTQDTGPNVPGTDFKGESYNWVNCVKMKNKNNADSYMLFANMVYVNLYCAMYPKEDGSMHKISGWKPPKDTPPGTPPSPPANVSPRKRAIQEGVALIAEKLPRWVARTGDGTGNSGREI